MTLRLLEDSILHFYSRHWIIALGNQGQIGGPQGCCDLRTGVDKVGASATSVRRQRCCLLSIQSSGRGNVGASATSFPDNYRESLEQLRTGVRTVEDGREKS